MKRLAILALIVVMGGSIAVAAVKHTVVPKDTLWDLAEHYYKDPFKWRKIEAANPPPDVNDPNLIFPGQVIIIPDLEPEPEAKAPEPEKPAETESEEAVAEAAPAEPVAETPAEPPDMIPPKIGEALGDSLSKRLPDGMIGASPSMERIKVAREWKEDGKVIDPDNMNHASATGDFIDVRIENREVQKGARFTLYRVSGPTDDDADSDSMYLSRVGIIKIRRPTGTNTYRAEVVMSVDTVQDGDLLRQEN